MKKALLLVTLSCLCAGGAALAQEKKPGGAEQSPKPVEAVRPATEAKPAAAESAPTVDQILAKYAEALGGRAAAEKHNTLAAKGAFDLPAMGVSGTVEIYGKAPNKRATVVSISGFGDVKQGFDGTAGWAQDPDSGKINDLAGTELSEAKINADFYRDFKLKELYPQLTMKGKEQQGGREMYVLEAAAPGVMKKFYFDAQSGLLARIDSMRESASGKISIEEYLEDYKEVDGVKFAHTYRQKNPQYEFTFKFDDVKHQTPVDDAKFTKPTQ